MSYSNNVPRVQSLKNQSRTTSRQSSSSPKGKLIGRMPQCNKGVCQVTWKPKPSAA